MDFDFYKCPYCGHTISGERVSDPGFVLLVQAHQEDHRAQSFEYKAFDARARADDARERARAVRAAAGIVADE